MSATYQPIYSTTNVYDTVALTRHGSHGAERPLYTTNDGLIQVYKASDDTWTINPTGADHPLVASLPSLEAAIDFILGVRALMAPAQDDDER